MTISNPLSRLAGLGELRADLRSGRAGWPVRLGLSLAAAAACGSLAMLGFGLVELADGYVRDAIAAAGLGVAGLIWTVLLLLIWSGYRRGPRILRTVFMVLGVGLVTVSACVVIDETTRADMLTASVGMLGVAVAIAIVATSTYRPSGGKAMVLRCGDLRVGCPDCGYSLVGLERCICPECGYRGTIDQVIWAQDYAAEPRPRLPEADAGSPTDDRSKPTAEPGGPLAAPA